VKRLQAYLGRRDPTEQDDAQENVRRLTEINTLLNARLVSMEHILRLQEAAVSQHNAALLGSTHSAEEPAGAYTLLQQWRTKTYELLVQQATAEVVRKQEAKRAVEAMQVVQQQIASKDLEINLLRHSCHDREAQVSLHQVTNTKLTEDFEVLQAKHIQAVSLGLDDRAAAIGLLQMAKSVAADFQQRMAVLATKEVQLDLYAKRLDFGLSRIRTIMHCIELAKQRNQPLVAAGLAALQAEAEATEGRAGVGGGGAEEESGTGAATAAVTTDEGGARGEEGGAVPAGGSGRYGELRAVVLLLQGEVQQLSKERDYLMARTKEDAALLGERTQAARTAIQDELTAAKTSTAELQQQVSAFTAEQLQWYATEEELRAALADHSAQLTTLKAERVAEAQLQQVAIIEQTTASRLEHSRTVDELQQKLQAAVADAAKAQALQRQAEWQLQRGEEKAATEESVQRQELKKRLHQAETQLRLITTERNLLVTNLRKVQPTTHAPTNAPAPTLALPTPTVEPAINRIVASPPSPAAVPDVSTHRWEDHPQPLVRGAARTPTPTGSTSTSTSTSRSPGRTIGGISWQAAPSPTARADDDETTPRTDTLSPIPAEARVRSAATADTPPTDHPQPPRPYNAQALYDLSTELLGEE
jgi:hypothetical protein